MLDLLTHIWPWLLGCLGIGGATGYLVKRPPREKGVAAWLVWAGLALAAGLIAAVLGVLYGRAGVYLETGIAAAVTFLAGAAGGTLARGGSLKEHEGWVIGLLPAVAAWAGANILSVPGLETGLRDQVTAALERAGAKADGVVVAGRDVTLAKPQGAEAAPLLGAIGNIGGLRSARVVDGDAAATIGGLLQKLDAEAGKSADATSDNASGVADKPGSTASVAGDKTAGAGAPGKNASRGKGATGGKGATAMGGDSIGHATAGAGAGSMTRDKAKAALATIPASGELDAATCQSALSATAALEKIQFRTGSATIRLASSRVLDKLAALIQRCPKSAIEVGGHTDNVGDDEANQELSQRRADQVVRYLEREGVARGRLAGVGYGAKKPIASNDDDDGRAENRRIEFIVK